MEQLSAAFFRQCGTDGPVSVLPVLGRHLTLGWNLQSDLESWGETYRKPAEQLASWLP